MSSNQPSDDKKVSEQIEAKKSLPPTIHIPVLPNEIIEWLLPSEWFGSGSVSDTDESSTKKTVIVDGTFGGGGHSILLATAMQKITNGQVIGVDRDPASIERFRQRMETAGQDISELPIRPFVSNFAQLPGLLNELKIERVDGILLDLGLSSDQLHDSERGFSYQSEGTLDLRFNPMIGDPAWKLLEHIGEKQLADLIFEFGEERYSRRVAAAIVAQRRSETIRTADQLAQLVRRCVPRSKNHAIDPATRTFQALRIAVNEELKWVSEALKLLPDSLKSGGRIAVISFHSLEDRIVKNAFRDTESLNVLTKKPIRPSQQEIESNPRSRSSRLRVAEKKDQRA